MAQWKLYILKTIILSKQLKYIFFKTILEDAETISYFDLY